MVFLIVFAYDIAFETLNHGRTIGKQAAGIRVVGQTGEPVRFLASAVRNIARILDFLPVFYLIGTISIIATARDQRVGDLAAGTLVMRDRFPGMARRPRRSPSAPPRLRRGTCRQSVPPRFRRCASSSIAASS